MLNLERIPDQVGYLVLNEDGAVVAVRLNSQFLFNFICAHIIVRFMGKYYLF
jgi:hypothetical protein